MVCGRGVITSVQARPLDVPRGHRQASVVPGVRQQASDVQGGRRQAPDVPGGRRQAPDVPGGRRKHPTCQEGVGRQSKSSTPVDKSASKFLTNMIVL